MWSKPGEEGKQKGGERWSRKWDSLKLMAGREKSDMTNKSLVERGTVPKKKKKKGSDVKDLGEKSGLR